MDKRRAERTRKRLVCSIELPDGRLSGLILDLSATGVFVQTGATLDPGDSVALEFEAPGSGETLRLHGRVARRRAVPVRLKSVIQAGIGVEIQQAPEGYYAMVAAIQDVSSRGSGAQKTRSRPPAPSPSASRPRAAASPASSTSRPRALDSRASSTARSRAVDSRASSTARSRAADSPPLSASRPRPAASDAAPAAGSEEKGSEEKKSPALSRLRKRYRVEVHEVDGKGARLVEVEALNAGAAGRKALVAVGPGWRVAGCERL